MTQAGKKNTTRRRRTSHLPYDPVAFAAPPSPVSWAAVSASLACRELAKKIGFPTTASTVCAGYADAGAAPPLRKITCAVMSSRAWPGKRIIHAAVAAVTTALAALFTGSSSCCDARCGAACPCWGNNIATSGARPSQRSGGGRRRPGRAARPGARCFGPHRLRPGPLLEDRQDLGGREDVRDSVGAEHEVHVLRERSFGAARERPGNRGGAAGREGRR